MDVKRIGEKDGILELLVKGTEREFMNSIRRAVMTAVPTLAMEDIAIYENDSVLFDELLAHRLGMIPLKTDAKRYKVGDKVRLTLEKEGPCTVYSKDIQSTDPKTEPVDKRIPVTKLKKGQRIKLEADAVMYTGKEHVKWQPAVISYSQLPTITIGKECNLCKLCIENCARNALEIKAKKVVLKDPFKCNLCGKCRDVCEKGWLTIGYDDSAFVMRIEPSGVLRTPSILFGAVDALRSDTKEFRKEVKKLRKG